MGFLHRAKSGQDAGNLTMFHMGLALLTTVSCLKPFGDNRNVFFREAATGMNVWAFYLARITVDTVDVCLQCVLYVGIYYVITASPLNSGTVLEPCLLISLICSSWGYLISSLVNPQNAVLTAVVVMVLLTGVFGSPNYLDDYINGGIKEVFVSLSITRWSVQMVYMAWLEEFKSFKGPVTSRYYAKMYSSGMLQKDFDPSGYWETGVLALVGYSVLLRIIGYLCLLSQSGGQKRSVFYCMVDVLLLPITVCQNCFHPSSKNEADEENPLARRRHTVTNWQSRVSARAYADME